MIKEFNALKGILAMMIFIHHLQLYDGGGSLAVAMFFMLGGFLSVLGYKEKILEADFSYKNYIIGKAIKFYPLHWLLLLVALPLSLYGSKHLFAQLAIMGINASLLCSWFPIEKVYFSCNAVSWYLSDTIVFVAIFPFVLKWMITASTNQKSIITLIIVLVYTISWIVIPDENVHRFFYINPIFRSLDYAVGMAAALFYLRLKECESTSSYLYRNYNSLMIVRIGCFIALVAISCLSAKYTLHAVVYMPMEAILLILIALMGGILQLPLLQSFGTVGFAFFLTHQVVIRYLHIIWGRFECDNIYILAPTAFVITTLLSYYLTFYFDKNISLWLKKKINQQSMTAQS